jgi:hypothetical protein
MVDPIVVGSATTASGTIVPTVAEVPVTPAITSKINITQVVAVGSSLLTFFFGNDIGLTPAQQAFVVTGITLVQGAVTWVLKTWFTKSIHASSLPKGS